MALLTSQVSDYGGTEIAYIAADAAGDTAFATEHLVLHVKNAGTVVAVVTVGSFKSCNQGFLHSQNVTVDPGEDRFIGPFATRFWNPENLISWTYDQVTGVTVAAIVID